MAASKTLAPPAAPRHFFGVDMNGSDVLAPVASVSSPCGTPWTMRRRRAATKNMARL